MNDRELLEMAAKAAGYQIHVWGTKGAENVARMDVAGHPRWNPLTDDGDALRLAVKLGGDVSIGLSVKVVVSSYVNGVDDTDGTYCGKWIVQGRNDDAAVRECIVRAAAEIGKAMP